MKINCSGKNFWKAIKVFETQEMPSKILNISICLWKPYNTISNWMWLIKKV